MLLNIRTFTLCASLLGLIFRLPVAASAQQEPGKTAMPAVVPLAVPAPVSPAPYVPFAHLPAPPLDETNNGIGFAQQMARSRKLQGRVLWIDATANLDNINTPEKIIALVQRIKKSGFNTIVLEVKPIVGFLLYPSQFAPKLTTWKERTLPVDFDPVPVFLTQAHAQGLQVVASLNVFSEGHRDFHLGPGYDHPEWQTVLYDVDVKVQSSAVGSPVFPVTAKRNQAAAPESLAYYDDLTRISAKPGTLIAVLDNNGKVVAQLDGSAAKAAQALAGRGGALVGEGAAQAFLQQYARVGDQLSVQTSPIYVPISARPEMQVPLMVNPHRADVQQRMRDLLTELCAKYEIDGVIFDDRLRYAGINADFSEETRKQFEAYVGKAIHWPDDVFHYAVEFPALAKRVVPGSYYDAWLLWRAQTLRNWLASAVATVKTARPSATVSVYAGSWYGEYANLGANWAADDFMAGFRFLTPSYQKTGYAGLIDWLTTGCYYSVPTIAEAAQAGVSAGATIEAAGQLSNRAVNDQTWVYAGINVADYLNQPPEVLEKTLQAACASTQGVMVFDLSYFNDGLWSIFEEAFRVPAIAPHAVPGLLAALRAQHLAHRTAGTPDPPVIIHNGIPGTGL